MTLTTFTTSLQQDAPPPGLTPCLLALWWDGRGSWEKAHDIVQDLDDATAAWVHAYLHRKEGDTGNARYWYSRAGRRMPALSLEEEWKGIVNELLGHG